jgi:hypothetical protein
MLGYLSPISHWQQWIAAGMPTSDDSIPFNKHSDLNRCRIDSPNGPLTLTIPVKKFEGKNCPLSEVRISEHGDWRHKHWHALASTYFNSPYFEYYQDDFRPIYFGQQERLVEFNAQLNRLVAELLNLEALNLSTINSPHLSPLGESEGAYYQVFAHKHGFIANLSIIDLLFNMGPESLLWLK